MRVAGNSSPCLTSGKHTPGSPWEAECPVRPERASRRSERSRKANATRARRGLRRSR
jgi:hypothetical protein